MEANSLAGLGVLVTRPEHQADALCQLIEKNGGKAIRFPTMIIQPASDQTRLKNLMRKHYDIAIFVSANAVSHAMPLWPVHALKIIAIGHGTAKALQKNNAHVDAIPQNYNSEGLLALPMLDQIKGKAIVIFCGENSRPLLRETLEKRGAHVESAICYRRKCPAINALPTLPPESIDLIISTSQENLRNLTTLLPMSNNPWLYNKQLLVISPTMADLAHQLGFTKKSVVAKNASDQAVADAVSTIYQ